jgi:hypothetical protein
MENPIEAFEKQEEQRETELRTLTAEELHLQLVEDRAHLTDTENQHVYARRAAAQSLQVMKELLIESGDTAVYFPEGSQTGTLLNYSAMNGFHAKEIARNPKFKPKKMKQVNIDEAEVEAERPLKPFKKKSSRRISAEEADRRRN